MTVMAVPRPGGKGQLSIAHKPVLNLRGSAHPWCMSKTRASLSPERRGRAKTGALPSNLYAYVGVQPSPRIGRPPNHDLTTWTITDDWPDPIPVTEAEIAMFEQWFGNLFDELFGPNP